jgi:hypothetical protein
VLNEKKKSDVDFTGTGTITTNLTMDRKIVAFLSPLIVTISEPRLSLQLYSALLGGLKSMQWSFCSQKYSANLQLSDQCNYQVGQYYSQFDVVFEIVNVTQAVTSK